jgi:flagellar basal-body rod protein FlgB
MLDPTTANLGRYMDLLSARQKLVTSNIANADTPGYKTQDIDFQFEFMSLAGGQAPQTIQLEALPEKPDGNNVSMDRGGADQTGCHINNYDAADDRPWV